MEENQQQNIEEEENEEEDRFNYSPIDYDPNNSDKIICIELENNQQIFIAYKQDWTVQNLISEVLTRKEVLLLQQNRNLILTSQKHPQIFDFSLYFYDSIFPDHENKIADYFSIEKLHEFNPTYQFPKIKYLNLSIITLIILFIKIHFENILQPYTENLLESKYFTEQYKYLKPVAKKN